MAKPAIVQPFPGVRDALTLLEIIVDPEKGKAALETIMRLESLRIDVNQRIDALGKLEDADAILAQARVSLGEAGGKLRAADDEAQRLLNEAAARIARGQLDLDAERTTFAALSADARRALDGDRAALAEQTAEIASRETNVAAREAAVQRIGTEVSAMKEDLARRLALIDQARAA